MSTPQNESWLILFSVMPGQYQRSLVLFRQFIEKGLGDEVSITDDAYLPNNQGFCFFFIVTATDQSVIETALSPAAGIYEMTIIKLDAVSFDESAGAANYCIYGWDDLPDSTMITRNAEAIKAAVSVRTSIKLPEGNNFSYLYLVHASSGNDALQFGHYMHAGTFLISTDAIAAAPYYEKKFGSASDTNDGAITPLPAAAIAADPNDDFTIINGGSNAMYCFTSAVPDPDSNNFIYTFFFLKRQVINPGQSIVANRKAFIWNQLSGPLYYFLNYWTYSAGSGQTTSHSDEYTLESTYTHPILATPDMVGCNGAVLSFNNAGQPGFQVINQLYQWLHDILLNNTCDLAWPEDSYAGDELAAYNYILGQIKILLALTEIVPPKSGNISADTINLINYPAGATYPQATFTSVKVHLFAECTYFSKSKDWFAVNGIISAINTQIAVVSADDLIAAANLMGIPPKTTEVSVILDTVISAISSIVSAIPGAGSAIAAAINIGWSVAKLSMQPGQSSQPIQAAVADMADILIERLQYVVNATATQYSIINNNWGKLKEFGTLVIEGKITATMFGMQTPTASKAAVEAVVAPPPPQGYVIASAKAWSVIIYKALFATQHTPTASIALTTNMPVNPWNPDAGNYNFVYALNAYYYDSKNNQTNGYAAFNCSTDAATQVMQKLFGTTDPMALNVDPVEFFMGFNGWPNVVAGYGNYDRPNSPIIQIGY